MSVINFKTVGSNIYKWENMTDGDTGNPLGQNVLPDKTVAVSGTINSPVDLVGSMDGVNWFPLHDISGEDIIFTSGGMKVILENPLMIRPIIGTLSTGSSVTVTISGSL